MTTQTPPGAAQPGSADTADRAAPLDAVLADAALGTFRRSASQSGNLARKRRHRPFGKCLPIPNGLRVSHTGNRP